MLILQAQNNVCIEKVIGLEARLSFFQQLLMEKLEADATLAGLTKQHEDLLAKARLEAVSTLGPTLQCGACCFMYAMPVSSVNSRCPRCKFVNEHGKGCPVYDTESFRAFAISRGCSDPVLSFEDQATSSGATSSGATSSGATMSSKVPLLGTPVEVEMVHS